MDHYQDLALKLLKTELSPESNQSCISLYQPNQNYSKQQIFQQVKSLFLQALRDNERLKSATNERDLLEQIREKITKLDSLLAGLGIFILVEVDGSQLKVMKNQLHVLPLGRLPIREYYSGPRFDVDQLVMIAGVVTDALVIDLKRKEYFTYIYSAGKLEEVERTANEYIVQIPNRYLEKYTPTGRGDGIIYSTGSDKVDKQLLKQNELFLQDLIKKIKTYPYTFQHLVIFYSNLFSPFIDNYLQQLQSSLPNIHLVTQEKNIKKRQVFRKEVEQILTKHIQEDKLQLLDELENDYYSVVETWEDIAQAVRHGQVRRFLIRPNLSVKGYVGADGLVYVNQPEIKARAVDNVLPWMVAAVIDQKGEVVVFTEKEFRGRPHKLAQLRYKLNKQEKRS
jgi:hypothetical protein